MIKVAYINQRLRAAGDAGELVHDLWQRWHATPLPVAVLRRLGLQYRLA